MAVNARNIARGGALAFIFGLGAYAYVGNRELVSVQGTVDKLSATETTDGTFVDKTKPVYLDDGKRLTFHRTFNGAVAVGQCYDFTLVNTVSALLLTASAGEIIKAEPCPPKP